MYNRVCGRECSSAVSVCLRMRTGAAEKILTCVFEISGAWPLSGLAVRRSEERDVMVKIFIPFKKEMLFSGLSLISPGIKNPMRGNVYLAKNGANDKTSRKQGICWSSYLHKRFANALQQLGGSEVYRYEFGLTFVVFIMQQKELIQLRCEARLKCSPIRMTISGSKHVLAGQVPGAFCNAVINIKAALERQQHHQRSDADARLQRQQQNAKSPRPEIRKWKVGQFGLSPVPSRYSEVELWSDELEIHSEVKLSSFEKQGWCKIIRNSDLCSATLQNKRFMREHGNIMSLAYSSIACLVVAQRMSASYMNGGLYKKALSCAKVTTFYQFNPSYILNIST
ncbi:hypothetical protein Tco_1085543 [Tanacetum coccineum]